LINSTAISLFGAFAGTANVCPPDTVTLPGSWPSSVGIAVKSYVSSHSGQGAFPSSSQLPGIQLPSSAMPTSSLGISSVEILAPACPVIPQLKLGPKSFSYTLSRNSKDFRNPSLSTIHSSLSSSYKSSSIPYSNGKHVCIVVPSPIAFPELAQKGTSTSSLMALAASSTSSQFSGSQGVSIPAFSNAFLLYQSPRTSVEIGTPYNSSSSPVTPSFTGSKN